MTWFPPSTHSAPSWWYTPHPTACRCVSMHSMIKAEECGAEGHQSSINGGAVRQWDVLADSYAEGAPMPWGGWLQQNAAWWEAAQRHPSQVLWLTFEEVVADAPASVRRVADFLGVAAGEAMVAATAVAIGFEAMRATLARHPKLRQGCASSRGGPQLGAFSHKQLKRFRRRRRRRERGR